MRTTIVIFLFLTSLALAGPQRLVTIDDSGPPNLGPIEKLIADGWVVTAVAGGRYSFVFVMELPDDVVTRAKKNAEAELAAKRAAFEKRREEYLAKQKATPVEGVKK